MSPADKSLPKIKKYLRNIFSNENECIRNSKILILLKINIIMSF